MATSLSATIYKLIDITVSAGWYRDDQYFLSKRYVIFSKALKHQVLPWLNRWAERYALANRDDASCEDDGMDIIQAIVQVWTYQLTLRCVEVLVHGTPGRE